jgi:hypothetical protein
MRVHEMSIFDYGNGPYSNGRSKEAIDFANKAMANIGPWLKEHYQLATLDEAAFTPGDLFNYHLRGDYYLGLTKEALVGDPLDIVNLATPPGALPSLVHIAQRTGDTHPMNTSEDTARWISGLQDNIGITDYGIRFAEGPIPPVEAQHFFTTEVASGSSLTEFLFPELGTMFYRLLPYASDFQQEVSKFLTEESLNFMKNARHLTTHRASDATKPPFEVHGAIRIDDPYIEAMMDTLDNIGGVPIITPTQVGNGSPDFRTMIDPTTPDHQALTCLLPLHYAFQVNNELIDLIYPTIEATAVTELQTRVTNLIISAMRACIGISRRGNITTRLLPPASPIINTENYHHDNTKRELKTFFDSYFVRMNQSFPVGSIVEINTKEPSKGGQSPIITVMDRLKVGPISSADFITHITTNTLFRVIEIEIRTSKKKIITHFALMSVDEDNIPITDGVGNTVQTSITAAGGIVEVYKGSDMEDYTGFSAPERPSHYAGSTDINNIIGRCLLSTCYSIFNAGAYYSSERDMRVLTKGQPPGHFPPILESIMGAAMGNTAHKTANKRGIIDFYADIRSDLMAIYLAAMYDNIKGTYRDQFVAFYMGDFHLNELDYYTSAVSNYIDSRVAPEDDGRQPVLVGPRLTTRVPMERNAAGVMVPSSPRLPGLASREFTFTRSADPEVVYYQIDSPLLREAYRNLNQEFYQWYIELARQLDSGVRNQTPGGNTEWHDSRYSKKTGGYKSPYAGAKDDKSLVKTIKPTKLILTQMWPLISQRAAAAVESGEVPAHTMMIQIADAVRRHRNDTSRATPIVPVSSSFINFGKLLRDPAQYTMPPSTSSADVISFLAFIEATYHNDYSLIAELASSIESARVNNYTQDQLISAFKAQYATFRNTKALNRFSFPAAAHLVRIFRELVNLGPGIRQEIAATSTTAGPPAPREEPATGPPVPLPVRRLPI